jgi:hypothetical protein
MASNPLAEAFGFDAEDLAHNRRGEFSPRQRATERKDAAGCRRSAGIAVLLAAGLVGAAIALRSELLGGFAVPAGVFGLVALLAFVLSFTKSTLKIAAVRGPAKLTMDRTRGAPKHVLIVQGTYFEIPHSAYSQIEEGASYAVYYVPHQRAQVLSVEKREPSTS